MNNSSVARDQSFMRRSWRAIAACLFLLLSVPAVQIVLGNISTAKGATNPITTENQLQGSSNWQLGNLIADDSVGQIKGYASAASVAQGGSITLYVSVNTPQTYKIDIYRMGWYNGLGGRLMQSFPGLAGTSQPACPQDTSTGLTVCNWAVSRTVAIPATWTSGIYLALLTNAQGYQSYITFTVLDTRVAPVLFQQSVTTYQAYNNFPNNSRTGKSLYEFNSFGPNTVSGTTRAVKVSFDRPYADEGSGQFMWGEINMLRWLEKNGYDVTYSTDIDTHSNGARLKTARAFLSVGHDEYWTKEMFDAAQSARDSGVNLAFLDANAIYWQIRLESSAGGVANRVVVGYKDANTDPIKGTLSTVNFRDPGPNRPEQTLLGVQFVSAVPYGSNVPWVVQDSGSWVYAGAGVTDGDQIPGLVGYEMDRHFAEYAAASNVSQNLLAKSPFVDTANRSQYQNASIYQAPSGAWVFAAGTISWSWGLDGSFLGGGQPRDLSDARVQRMMTNILDKFLQAPAPPVTPPAPTWRFVQSLAAPDTGSSNTSQATPALNTNVTAGDRLIVVVNQSGEIGPTSVTSVTDSAGNVYSKHLAVTAAPQGELSVWSAPINAGGGTKPTITVTTAARAFRTVSVYEYSGLSTATGAAAIDASASFSGGGGNWYGSLLSGVVPAPSELVIAAVADNGSNVAVTPTSDYTRRTGNTPTAGLGLTVADKGSGPPGNQVQTSMTSAIATGVNWMTAAVVFKPGSGGAGVPTTTTLASSANPSNAGQSVTFTATVSPSAATGTVTFMDGSTTLGSGTLTTGTATFTTAALASGSHSITAVYGGNATYASSSSPPLTQTVNPPSGTWQYVQSLFVPDAGSNAATTTSPPLNSAMSVGDRLMVVVNQAGEVGPTSVTSVTDSAGNVYTKHLTQTAVPQSELTVWSAPITAGGGTKPTISVTTAATAFKAIAIYEYSGLSTVSGAGAIDVTASVQGSGGTSFSSGPTAATTGLNGLALAVFADNGSNITINPTSDYTLRTSSTPTANNSLTTGDKPSGPVGSQVQGTFTSTTASPTDWIAAVVVFKYGGPPPASTTTALASSANPSTIGQSVTFTATVTPSAATGTVTFKDGTTTLGTGTLNAGTATFATSALTAGSHSITAAYGGSSTYAASTSPVLTQTVNPGSTATSTAVASSANPSTAGQSVTFTATVTPSAATGTVTFKDGTTTLGTGTLNAGMATFASSALAAGSHSITAVYGGDASYAASTSPALTQTVNPAASWQVVQSLFVPDTGNNAATQTTPALNTNVTLGNRLIVVVNQAGEVGATSVTSVTDSAGNVYTKHLTKTAVPQNELTVWSAPITVGGGTKPTITVTTGATSFRATAVYEYSGLSTVSGTGAVDVSASNVADGQTSFTSGPTAATTMADELALAIFADNGSSITVTPTSDYTSRTNATPTGNNSLVAGDKKTGVVGSQIQGTFTSTTASPTNWIAAVVVFKRP